MLRSFLLIFLSVCSVILGPKAYAYSDSSKTTLLSEGILQTRISFPGNPINDLLSSIDFKKGNIAGQLEALKDVQNSKAYADKMKTAISKMSAAEQQAMGSMLMGVLMSPIYATIYFDKDKALAKAYALNYTLESFMNTSEGYGQLVAVSNDKSNEAAIRFSGDKLEEAWQKEKVSAEHYAIQWVNSSDKVGGFTSKKAIFTLKAGNADSKVAKKVIVWYSSELSNRVNFLHPFYVKDIQYGITKIEVHYDAAGKNRMLYEVTGVESRKPNSSDFEMTAVTPVLDWNSNQTQAGLKMLSVFMSQGKATADEEEED